MQYFFLWDNLDAACEENLLNFRQIELFEWVDAKYYRRGVSENRENQEMICVPLILLNT